MTFYRCARTAVLSFIPLCLSVCLSVCLLRSLSQASDNSVLSLHSLEVFEWRQSWRLKPTQQRTTRCAAETQDWSRRLRTEQQQQHNNNIVVVVVVVRGPINTDTNILETILSIISRVGSITFKMYFNYKIQITFFKVIQILFSITLAMTGKIQNTFLLKVIKIQNNKVSVIAVRQLGVCLTSVCRVHRA